MLLLLFFCEDLVSRGALNGDEVARALVPNLLRKADRQQRGLTRTGTHSSCDVGIMKLGFALGNILSNPEVQRVFGLSRSCARPPPALRSPLLPFFFCSFGEELQEACRAALSLLEVDGTNHYMLVRDEVAYARSFNLIYGCGRGDSELKNLYRDLGGWVRVSVDLHRSVGVLACSGNNVGKLSLLYPPGLSHVVCCCIGCQ